MDGSRAVEHSGGELKICSRRTALTRTDVGEFMVVFSSEEWKTALDTGPRMDSRQSCTIECIT